MLSTKIYPVDLGPFDPGARWSIQETTHEDCNECMTMATVAGDTFNHPEHARHWLNAAASADFTQEIRRAPAYHSAMVRRERAQPWTPPAWATTPITEGPAR